MLPIAASCAAAAVIVHPVRAVGNVTGVPIGMQPLKELRHLWVLLLLLCAAEDL